MKKLFLSADIEGTCGIAHWDETDKKHADYPHFARQMTREVAAACEGAISAGFDEILVRDSHDSARNIDPEGLPEEAYIFRSWSQHPYSMMSGVDETYDGVIFTGYHSAASWEGNPLSHTMNTRNNFVKINGEVASELMMNSLTASMHGVPILMVTGDQMLCEWFNTKCPGTLTVPVSMGQGNGSISMHPNKAVSLIRENAARIGQLDLNECRFPMPEFFEIEVNYRQHYAARKASFYPGCEQVDSKTVRYQCVNWMDALCFFAFCL